MGSAREHPVEVRWRGAAPPEPPPCPEGWVVAPPDFVGVGAHRAGTTRWYDLIVEHPQVQPAISTRKELHFFSSYAESEFTSDDAERYRRCFPRPPGQLTGEWTPRYMFELGLTRMLAQAAPEAKILVSLRDPVARYVSGFSTNIRKARKKATKRGKELPDSPRWRWQVSLEHLARSSYLGQLERLLRHFPREQVLLLQYEKCRDEPVAELARTFAFLGLEPADFVPEQARLLAEAHPSPSTVDLDPEVRADLIATFSGEVKALAAEFPEIELERWPSFRHLA